jgi:predicted flap endonuclease-1-like 5' DNA nuclease
MTQLEDNKKAEEKAATKKAKAEKEETVKEKVILEEAVKEEAVVEKKSSKKESKGADDLKKIEGIGPKIASILTENGVVTFADLAITEVDKIKEILMAAGSRYKMHDPTTWPEQAKLAAAGDWNALEKLQASLDGGKK